MGGFGVLAGRPLRSRLWVMLATVLAFALPQAAVSSAQAAVASTVSLSASPAVAAAGESVMFSGVVLPAVSGRTVWLQRYGSTWSTVASVKTSVTGRFTAWVMHAPVAGSRTPWRAVARPGAGAAQAVSATRVLSVVAQRLSVSAPSSAETRRAFTLTGYGYPVRAGRVVVVQRLSGRSWTEVGRGAQSSSGRFKVLINTTSAARIRYRAVEPSWHGAAGVTAASRVVSVHAPYIVFAPTTVFAGESVRVSGTLPGVASRPVWVKRLSGTKWVTLVRSTTTRTGSYATSFKAPAPEVYQVRRLAPKVTIAGKVKAQYVTPAKSLTVFASPHC